MSTRRLSNFGGAAQAPNMDAYPENRGGRASAGGGGASSMALVPVPQKQVQNEPRPGVYG